MKWKTILISNRIKQLIMLVLFAMCITGIFQSIMYETRDEKQEFIPIEDLNTDWDYVDEKGNSQKVKLPLQAQTKPDKPVSITRILPKDHIQMERFSICFRSSQQDVDVYLENELIYHYDSHADNPFGKASFSRWNLIELPQGFEEKELRITTQSPYEQYSGSFNTVKWGHETALYSSLIEQHFMQFILGLLLIFVGFLFAIIYLLGIRKNADYQQFGELGFLVLLIGLWLYSESKMPEAYMFQGFTAMFATHNSLLLMPLPFILYVNNKTTVRTDAFLSVLFYICIVEIVGVNILQLTGQCDYIETLIVSHLMLGVSISSGIYCMWCCSEKKLNVFERFAFLTGFLSVTIEILWYISGNRSHTGKSVQIGIVIATVFITVSEIWNLIDEAKKSTALSERLQDKKAYIAASQMKPHFIYNALGAISTMIYTNPDDAYKAMNSFIKYLRASVGSQNFSKLIPFSQELEHIKAYCDIEYYRFGDRIRVLYQLENVDFLVPPISIQPLVENAIKHGVFPKRNGGTVTIAATSDSGEVVIKIMDDGVGFYPSEAISGTSIGLANLTYRLKTLCNASVEIESKPEQGTTVTIRIPKRSL